MVKSVAQSLIAQGKLLRVLALSIALSVAGVMFIAYFYGSVQTGKDVLIAPRDLTAISFRDIDLESGRSVEFFVDGTNCLKWQDHTDEVGACQIVSETTYRAIYQALRKDHLSPPMRAKDALNSLYTLRLQCRPRHSSKKTAELDLQRIDFLEDGATYRVTGRRDRKEGELFWHFTHRGAPEEIAKLISSAGS